MRSKQLHVPRPHKDTVIMEDEYVDEAPDYPRLSEDNLDRVPSIKISPSTPVNQRLTNTLNERLRKNFTHNRKSQPRLGTNGESTNHTNFHLSSKNLSQLAKDTIRSPIIRTQGDDYFSLPKTHGNENYGSIRQDSSVKSSQLHIKTHHSSTNISTREAVTVSESYSGNGSYINRNFYDDFTSVDWVRDYLFDVSQRGELSLLHGFNGQIKKIYNSLQDWILITIVAFLCSTIAYIIDKSEELLVDFKRGCCVSNLLLNQQQCCSVYSCASWKIWPEVFNNLHGKNLRADFIVYILLSLLLAWLSVKITLTTKTINPFADKTGKKTFKVMYSAYGSGVPEVKTILSGFVIRKFLGSYTLFTKSVALVFAIASGMSLGKEGPYVHLATCVGNICCRLFEKFQVNGIERRVILSASTAAGVTLAFGSPLGGVLFSLEEVSYYLPGNQLFKTFFCSIMSHFFLSVLNPYGTGKAVLFEVSYTSDWQTLEIFLYILIGIAGGIFGALFCKFADFWGNWFRRQKFIHNKPVFEVLLIALVSSILTFFNPFTNIAVSELLANLSSPCYSPDNITGTYGLCPIDKSLFPDELWSLLYALVVKIILTGVTFGIKVPAGIYVPSMVIGALFGRIFAMYFQYLGNIYPDLPFFSHICGATSTDGVCVDLGIYAMISAGAFMAGVTRMNLTLATIMFELTSSYNYVVPISIAIAVSNFVAYAIESNSLYEMLIKKNDFPFLDNRKSHDFYNHQTDLSQIITRVEQSNPDKFVDVSTSNSVSVTLLRNTLQNLQREGLVDGYLPVLKHGKLIGVLPAPELELVLDKLSIFSKEYHISRDIQVKLLDSMSNSFPYEQYRTFENFVGSGEESILFSLDSDEQSFLMKMLDTLCDFTHIMEKSPIILDINSPLSLVELIFTKLGNRSITIMSDGEFVGFLHKKIFIDHCRDKKLL